MRVAAYILDSAELGREKKGGGNGPNKFGGSRLVVVVVHDDPRRELVAGIIEVLGSLQLLGFDQVLNHREEHRVERNA